MNKHTLAPILTPVMAAEIADELEGLAASADEPKQYDAKIAALRAIERGFTRVARVPVATSANKART